MKKAIAIARVSSDEQAADDRTSLDSQLADIELWAAQHSFEIVDRIQENGVSVSRPLDPEISPRPFWEAYGRLKAGEVDAVVFWRDHRFSRDPNALRPAALLEDSRQYGSGILFADQPPPAADDEMGQVSSFLRSWASAQDAKNRRESTMRGVLAQWERGRWAMGTPPLGYRWDKEAHRLVIVEEQAEIVRLVFRLYATEGRGANRIAGELNARGIQPPAGSKGWKNGRQATWSSGAVSRMLRRDYTSHTYVRTYGGRSFSFPVEPIVDEELYERARQIRESRPRIRAGGGGTGAPRFGTRAGRTGTRGMFQGLVHCGLCGRRWHTGYVGRSPRRVSYYCPARLASRRKPQDDACRAHRWLAADLDRLVWGAIRRALRDGETFRQVSEAYLDRLEGRITAANPLVVRARDRLDELRAQRQRALDVEVKYGTDQAERIAGIDSEIEASESALRTHAHDAAHLQRLRDERETMRAALAKYGGRFWIEAEDSDGPGEEVRIRFARDREPDEWSSPDSAGRRHLKGIAALTRGTESRKKWELVDLLGIKLTVFPERVEVEGAIDTSLVLSSMDTTLPRLSA